MISFFPIAVSVSIGLSTLEPEYRDILRSLGASQFTGGGSRWSSLGNVHGRRIEVVEPWQPNLAR